MPCGPRVWWEAFGPVDRILPADGEAELHSLQARPALNGALVTLQRWDGPSGRFIVTVRSSEERIKIRRENVKCQQREAPSSSIARGEILMGRLPMDLGLGVCSFLKSRGVAHLSTTCVAARDAFWNCQEAVAFWRQLLTRSLGVDASCAALRARPAATGPALYRTAVALRRLFRDHFEIVSGSVTQRVDGAEVVACPVLRSLRNSGIGAQGAIRRMAGDELEAAVKQLEVPLPGMSVTMVPGGALAKHVALVVTEPPRDIWGALQGTVAEQVRAIVSFLDELHAKVLQVAREAGLRSLVMPTLCTGGMGVPAHIVAIAAVRAIHRDFVDHIEDPMRVRVACFEESHVQPFNGMKDEVLQYFYQPDLADNIIMSALLDDENEP